MKNQRNRSVMFMLFTVFISVMCLTALCLFGCLGEDQGEDRSVNSITITGIPEFIAVDNPRCNKKGHDCLTRDRPCRGESDPYYRDYDVDKKSSPFSIYINVSDHMDHTDKNGNLLLPVAKGYAQFTEAELDPVKRTYTITVNFMDPNPGFGMPPYNPSDKPWKGTAKYFSVSISPYDITEYGLDEVWVKGGLTLNKGKETIDWSRFIDFRKTGTIDYSYQADELYKLIISADKNIESGTRPYHYGYPHGGDTGAACPGHNNNDCNKYASKGKPCEHNMTHGYFCYPHFSNYREIDYREYYFPVSN